MEPDRAQDIRDMLAQHTAMTNLLALAYYANLLKTCGVKELRVYSRDQ